MHDANIKRYCADSVQLWTGGSRGLLTRESNMCPPALIAIALREAIKEGGYAGMFWQIICAVDEPYSYLT